ncbi:hypothetical protein ASPVEDRAFT_301060 [Aspergillus versicolor CBS 583.65]|uniref:F-box domain-containing protein n=1 Tax=Aspergillus versicolor CBS 583.65 TaxID=1036611 RepID=A0A1L9P7Y0_ASPVE|nr:uncharacterized protein ASPVEDRAFT_301060 [Aspergillus versicolor CBS 583.65]OJI97586.1 hypothetical protein ASPVEDRAFT_301060 [Aspergillus versicolor CBS 583.65]
MDPFTRLPPELITQIILYIADFSAVESFISASPQVQAIFQAQPSIVQDLLQSDPITSFPEIQKLCYNISLIQTSLPQCPNLAHYQQSCDHIPVFDYTEALCMLRLAARTQRLACTCMTTIQHNLISPLSEVPAGSLCGPDRVRKAREPFSWTEEYRVYCSIWHLQHYSCLRKAATERWGWDQTSIQTLDAYDVWNDIIDTRHIEKFWTIAALLSDLGLNPSYGHYPFQHRERSLAQDPEGEESSRAAWTFPPGTPPPFFPSFDLPPSQYLRDGNSSPFWSPPLPPPDTAATDAWWLTPKYRSWNPRHVSYFQLAASAVSMDREPASHSLVNLKPWRRLGVIIWDTWRIYSLGLCDFNRKQAMPTPDGRLLEATPRDRRALQQMPAVDYVSRWLALIGESRRPARRVRVGGQQKEYGV